MKYATGRPRKAFVLAAGYGTRMRPLSNVVPKPLLPLWNKPMLQHVLELLRDWGVSDVVINCHHLPDRISDFIEAYDNTDLQLNLSYEPEILGTGGALRHAEWFFDDGEPFWLINADAACDLDPGGMIRIMKREQPLSVLCTTASTGPRTVDVKNGRVTSFRSQSPGDKGTVTFCGLHLVSPRILDYLPSSGFSSIIDAYEKAMADTWDIRAVAPRKMFWADIGTPEQYLHAHAEIRQRAARELPGSRFYSYDSHVARSRRNRAKPALGDRGLQGRPETSTFACISPSAKVGNKVRVENSVVWPGAVLHSGIHLQRAIIATSVRLSVDAEGIVMPTEEVLTLKERAALYKAWDRTEHAAACFLGVRGSDRQFLRITHGKKTLILVRYGRKRRENECYARNARLLSSIGIHTPRILHHSASARFLLMEDLGTQSLENLAAGIPRNRVIKLYRRVLGNVVRLHTLGLPRFHRFKTYSPPPFSEKLLAWEHDLFSKEFLRNHMGMREREINPIRKELCKLIPVLIHQPQVLVHRDLQSSNILVKRGTPYMIDFQGMRPGPAAYDLASLLCDPYVMLDEDTQSALLRYYNTQGIERNPLEETDFWMAAIQRLLQALGAYARLGRIRGAEHFLNYIPNALTMLKRAINRANFDGKLQGLVEQQLRR